MERMCIWLFASMTLLLLVSTAMAAEETIEINKTEYEQLKSENTKLKNENARLKAENTKLQVENEKLKSKLQNLGKWDARTLMDRLFIYTVTPVGKEFKLLFHEGGLGGVVVYQYVGLWQGDAGKWRQYKQIAELKLAEKGEGFVTPGVVIRPVWGFEGEEEVNLTSMAQLIQWERKYNSIEGLAEYYKWMFNNYVESARYAALKLLIVLVIGLGFGAVFGEIKQPIKWLSDRITLKRVTYRLTPEEKGFRLRLRRR